MEPSARPACHRYKRAPAGRMRLVLALLCTACCVHGSRRHIECQDPDLISNPHNADRKYLLIGSEGSRGSGFGNLLIFFPAAFWFATFSGRNIIISDGSTVGEMCKIVGCGFPFASDLAKAYPLHFKDNALQHVPDVKQTDFVQWVEGSKNITANVVRGWGYQAQSDWWVYFNHTVHCVKKMTGCDLGDIACADRHAYQKLVRGPFKQSLTEIEEKRISGVPPHIKHAMLSLPHAYAPRLDAAVHLRAQFHHFEQQADVNDKEFRLEVQRWLNGTESKTVFRLLTERILSDFLADGKARPGNESRELSVYIAADNEEVKDAFASHLRNGSAAMGVAVNAMKVDSAGSRILPSSLLPSLSHAHQASTT